MNLSVAPQPDVLNPILEESAARHHHLCPRQVLGVRIGLAGLRYLGFIDTCYRPRFRNIDKRLLTIVETDGCGAGAVGAATDCVVGRRTLRVLDFGKVAATLIDTLTEEALRLAPSPNARSLAVAHAPAAASRWHSYLQAYKVIPDADLLLIQRVRLTRSLTEILSKPSLRTCCHVCGEEIMNEREIRRDGLVLCRTCAGHSYYSILNDKAG